MMMTARPLESSNRASTLAGPGSREFIYLAFADAHRSERLATTAAARFVPGGGCQ